MQSPFVQYISNAGVTVGIIPEIGGTIVFLSKDGSPNLIKSNPELWDFSKKPQVNENTDFVSYCGHTVWLGPQKEWWIHQSVNPEKKHSAADWPPDPYLYIADYTVITKTDSAIHLQGPHSPISGVTIEKEIAVNPDGSVFIQASITNTSNEPQAWDIWHNTRFDGMCRMSVEATKDNIQVVPVLNEHSTEMPYSTEADRFSYIPTKPSAEFSERSSKTFIYPTKPEITIETPTHFVQVLFTLHDKKEIHPAQGLVEIYNHTEHCEGNDLLEIEYHSQYKQLQVGEKFSAWEVWKITNK